MSISDFGPLVVGEVVHAREQAKIKSASNKFGPLVVDAPTEATNDAAAPAAREGEAEGGAKSEGTAPVNPDTNGDNYLSVAELIRALGDNAELVDVYFPAELAREKPRKSAFAALLAAEQNRPGGERAEVVATITDAMGG